MPVAAGVITDGLMPTLGTTVDMAAQSGGPAALDREQHFSCSQVSQARLRSIKSFPSARTMSASSTAGRLIWAAAFVIFGRDWHRRSAVHRAGSLPNADESATDEDI